MTKGVPLKKLASVQSGYTFRGRIQRDPNGDIWVVQMKDLDDFNQLDTNDIYTVKLDRLNKRYLLKPDDILFRARGSTHTAAHLKEIPPNHIAASTLTTIRVTSSKVLPAYVVWYLNQPAGQRQIQKLSMGTHIPTVNVSDLEMVKIPLPPLEVQHLITEVADLRQQEEQILQQLEAKKQIYLDAVLNQCITTGEN